MLHIIVCAVLVLACAALNRVRGGGFGGDRLRPHPRFYVAPAVGLLSWLVLPWLTAILVAVAYLAWAWLPWGHWYDLGRLPPDFLDDVRTPTWFERVLTDIADGNDHLAFTARNMIAIVPAIILVTPAFFLLPWVQLAAYEIGWRKNPSAPILVGELLTGAAWGVLIFAAIYV